MGADAFGFQTVWINRARLPDEYGIAPRTVNGLTQLTAFD
jgi:FMN phosphatase YigB (HAD superfamily)